MKKGDLSSPAIAWGIISKVLACTYAVQYSLFITRFTFFGLGTSRFVLAEIKYEL